MWELGIKLLLAYGLGTILGSMILGRLRGVDIRRHGSGNAGATNALRTQGKLFGMSVLAIDIVKGVLAIVWLPTVVLPGMALDAGAATPGVPREWLVVACGVAVILGHVYPVWYEFRGGKGAATVVGVIGAIEPRLLVPLIATWVVVLVLSGYVSLATMLAGVALVIAVAVREPDNPALLTFAVCTAAFVIYTHRANLGRLRAGTENRARRVWLFRSRAA